MISLTEDEKAYLLYVARGAISNKFVEDKDPEFEHPTFETDSDALVAKVPVFVSLYTYGFLRGVSGHYIPYNPLITEVYDRARFAAFDDENFPPVPESEVENLEICISVVTRPVPTALNDIVVGRHGILVKRGTETGAVLLPHTAVKNDFTVQEFWEHCCEKAGLSHNALQTRRLSTLRFDAIEFTDSDPIMNRQIQQLFAQG